MTQLTLVKTVPTARALTVAINAGLRRAMEQDSKVVLVAEEN